MKSATLPCSMSDSEVISRLRFLARPTLHSWAVAAVLVLLSVTRFAAGQSWHAPIREIAHPGLPDISVASFDAGGPVIYFNPDRVRQVGPALATFFRAHEYGHIELGHIHAADLGGNPFSRAWLRQGRELEADCYAAQTLQPSYPEALDAAVHFFRDIAPGQVDALHPPGRVRAAKIAACRQEGGSDEEATEKESTTLRFGSWKSSSGGWAELTVNIDGNEQGEMSNEFGADHLDIEVAPGKHTFELTDIRLFGRRGESLGGGGSCRSVLTVRAGRSAYELELQIPAPGELRCRIR